MNALHDKQLRQLGIPQWKLRTAANSESSNPSLGMIHMLWRSSVVGLCVTEQGADQNLLTAMLNATRCEWRQLEETLEALPKLSFSVIFGLKTAQLLLPELELSESDLNETLQLPSGPLLITHSISDTLADTSLKKPVWQSLQTAMRTWHSR